MTDAAPAPAPAQSDDTHRDRDAATRGRKATAGLGLAVPETNSAFARWTIARALSWGFAVATIVVLGWALYELIAGFEQSPKLNRARRLLWACLALEGALSAVLMWRIVRVWRSQSRALSSSRLFRRLIGFSMVSAGAPAVVVSTIAVLVMTLGLQGFFSQRVEQVVTESASTATSFLDEHLATQRATALRTALLLSLGRTVTGEGLASQLTNRDAINRALRQIRFRMGVDSAALIGIDFPVENGTGENGDQIRFTDSSLLMSVPELTLYGFSGENSPQDLEALIGLDRLSQLVGAEILVLTDPGDNQFAALVPFPDDPRLYVLVANGVSSTILNRVDDTQTASQEFFRLSDNLLLFQQLFTLLFVVTAITLALFAAWASLRLAVDLARPILRVTNAAQRLARGEWQTRVPFSDRRRNELDTLAITFNKMANDLGQQQAALREANADIEERRRFTEAVLAGVSAGVIGLDARGNIDLPNDTASQLLDRDLSEWIGKSLFDAVPAFMPLLELAHEDPSGVFTEEVTITRRNGSPRQLLTNAVAEAPYGVIEGYVFTFDDVTELHMAQRRAAWSDVARRIAHEIKNPLTPIQLSAERLKRRYLKEIDNNPQLFSDLIDTIVRQVGEIGRMVDEFSGFARMPEPRMADHDLRDIVRQSVFLQANAFEKVTVRSVLPDTPVTVRVDEQLFNQAIINLVKNAAENLEGLIADGKLREGLIEVQVHTAPDPDDPNIHGARVEVRDNGAGYPVDLLPKLAEPYVTTREKGTGLGLAIVRKVMEDHDGELRLLNGDSKENLCGARAILIITA